MGREWKAILRRHGQSVRVVTGGQEQTVRAFLQNLLDKDAQLAPSPMGLRREEQVLYLGPADVGLLPRESVVFWQNREYDVLSTRDVGDGHHCWAILQAKEGAV